MGSEGDLLNPKHEWEGSVTWGPDSHSFAASKLFGWLDFENKTLIGAPGISSHDVVLFSPNGKNLLSRNSDQAVLFEVTAVNGGGSVQQHISNLSNTGHEGVDHPGPATNGRSGKAQDHSSA